MDLGTTLVPLNSESHQEHSLDAKSNPDFHTGLLLYALAELCPLSVLLFQATFLVSDIIT